MQESSTVARESSTGPLQTRPLSPYVGVEIIGLDLEQPLSPEVERQLQALWIEYGLLLFRAVASEDAHLRISRCFGELQPSSYGAKGGFNHVGNPYLLNVTYNPAKSAAVNSTIYFARGEPRAGYIGWHWDQSFLPKMVRGGALRMIEAAAKGGETGFIDAIGAYERLPADLKSRIEGLEVVYAHTTKMETNRYGFPPDFKVLQRADDLKWPTYPPVVHPLVISQPGTGRKVLRLSPMHSKYILGLSAAESDALMQEISDHLTDERYAYFHSWSNDDVVIWDNWRIIHSAKGVPPDCLRRAYRTTLVGDLGLGRLLEPASAEGPENAPAD